MADVSPHRLTLNFPGDLEYVSAVRKLVSEVLVVNGYSHKFAYRSEVIVDEICTNAVRYGCKAVGAEVAFECLIWPDRIEVLVKDPGGESGDVSRLRSALAEEAAPDPLQQRLSDVARNGPGGLGLEIVRMLSESVDVSVDDNNVTSIRVVRRREETQE